MNIEEEPVSALTLANMVRNYTAELAQEFQLEPHDMYSVMQLATMIQWHMVDQTIKIREVPDGERKGKNGGPDLSIS